MIIIMIMKIIINMLILKMTILRYTPPHPPRASARRKRCTVLLLLLSFILLLLVCLVVIVVVVVVVAVVVVVGMHGVPAPTSYAGYGMQMSQGQARTLILHSTANMHISLSLYIYIYIVFIHIHQSFRMQYTSLWLDTVNIDWWWCIDLCRVFKYGFYYRFSNLRLSSSKWEWTSKCLVCWKHLVNIAVWFVSSEIMTCRLLKWLLDHPMNPRRCSCY